jgi:hypothetical protein
LTPLRAAVCGANGFASATREANLTVPPEDHGDRNGDDAGKHQHTTDHDAIAIGRNHGASIEFVAIRERCLDAVAFCRQFDFTGWTSTVHCRPASAAPETVPEATAAPAVQGIDWE